MSRSYCTRVHADYVTATPAEHAALILAGFEGPDSSGDYTRVTRQGTAQVRARSLRAFEGDGGRWVATAEDGWCSENCADAFEAIRVLDET